MRSQPDRDGKWLKAVIATQFVAADLVYTTPTQYASFIESLMNGAGESPAIRKLRESVLTDRKPEMCVGKMAKTCPDEIGFGPGWEVTKTHGKTFLMHTGLDEGVFTLGYFDPGARSGVIIFTQQRQWSAHHSAALEDAGRRSGFHCLLGGSNIAPMRRLEEFEDLSRGQFAANTRL